MKHLFFICSLIFSVSGFAQTTCEYTLRPDSATLQLPKKKEAVELLEVKIKNNYQVQFIKLNKKNYLKIIVRNDLGFGKTGSLLLATGKKQIFIRTITLQVIDKSSGYFLIELNDSFYLDNIKESGISKLVFNEVVEFGIPKSDADLIEKAAECFNSVVKDNIWSTKK